MWTRPYIIITCIYTTYCNIAGCNMLRAFGHPACRNTSQHGAQKHTCSPNNVVICCIGMLRSFGRGFSYTSCCVLFATLHVAARCDVLVVVGSNLTIFKLEPTTPNMSQHGAQKHTTCCAQQCSDMFCWHVVIVWPELHALHCVTSKKKRLQRRLGFNRSLSI